MQYTVEMKTVFGRDLLTALHVNFLPCVWHFVVFSFGGFFFLVCLLLPSFLISQRSPRFSSDDQVPENVEQRACQLAALLESRPAVRHQVTTALPVWRPASGGDSGYHWHLCSEGWKNSPEYRDHCLYTVTWLKRKDHAHFG